jgi:hypothetical protein
VAVIAFRPFLNEIYQRQFDQAWQNYYAYDDSGADPYEYLVKYGPGWEGKPIQECRSLAIDNIEKILAFAKQR